MRPERDAFTNAQFEAISGLAGSSGRRLRILGASLVAACTVTALGIAPVPHKAAADQREVLATRVVIVGVPGLLWGDLASGLAPPLTELASHAALGEMSVRAARSRTCVLDGWASLGAGNRARYPASTTIEEHTPPPLSPEQPAQTPAAGLTGCGPQELVTQNGLTDVAQTVARIGEDEGTRSFGADPGALGTAVSCSTAIGGPSAVAVSGTGAQVSIIDDLPADTRQLSAALSRCPLSLISVPDLIGSVPSVGLTESVPPADPVPLAGMLGRPRARALSTLDTKIGAIWSSVASLPGETLLLLVGLSEQGMGRAQLHPLIAIHPDLPPGYLSSASTGRAPYVQLIDVAPTALRALGIQPPDSMAGSAVRWAGPTGRFSTAIAHLRDLNRVALAHLGLTTAFFWTLVALGGALVAGLALVRVRSRVPARPGPHTGRALPDAALAFAVLPAATDLAKLTPWWRSPSPALALGMAVATCVALLVTLAIALGGRRGPVARLLPPERAWAGPALVVALATSLTIGLDVVLGSPMELNSLIGYNPIVAGRFVGLGNLSFGLFAVCTLLATAVLVRGAKPKVMTVIAAVGIVCVVIDGAAGLGADFGGVLALVPGFVLLALLVSRSRLTLRRMLSTAGATIVVVSTFALLDYQRSPDDRTHLGRFVAELIDGRAWTVISRKAQANLDVLTGSPVTWLIPIFAVAGWLMIWPGGGIGQFLAAEPGWRAGLFAALTSLAIGSVINDSGIAIPAVAGCVLVPVLIWLTLRWNLPTTAPATGSGTSPPRTPLDAPGASADHTAEPSR